MMDMSSMSRFYGLEMGLEVNMVKRVKMGVEAFLWDTSAMIRFCVL